MSWRTTSAATSACITEEPGAEICHYGPTRPSVEATDDAEKEILKVVSIDYNVAENTKKHHTDKFEITHSNNATPQLVVRRGQPFDVTIEFTRPFEDELDDLKIIFFIGQRPTQSNGRYATLRLHDEDLPLQWGAVPIKRDGNFLTMTIFTPPDIVVGQWDFKVATLLREGRSKKYQYDPEYKVTMLFNPWCSDDQVFLNDPALLEEYVLNDFGKIYYGAWRKICPKDWKFGQFEDFMLDCCFYLLDKCGMPLKSMNDPVRVAKKISSIVNAHDKNGVLVGNWSGDYSKGTSPFAWASSSSILEEYWRTKNLVSFGQCWVFSGLVTALCRCLGIPARSVTNFTSTQDSDTDLTVDYTGVAAVKSILNIHVWNKVWMANPEFQDGCNAWQEIDPTPQETNDGLYCTGPCSLDAICDGRVKLAFEDGKFMFTEMKDLDAGNQGPPAEPGVEVCHYGPQKPDEKVTEKVEKEILKVVSVDYNVAENTKKHHTDKFEITHIDNEVPQLVVRRGQPFDVTIEFTRPFEDELDDLKIIFYIGKRPTQNNGRYATLRLHDEDLPLQWGAVPIKRDGNFLTMTIFTPPDIVVGQWDFQVATLLREGRSKKYQYDPEYKVTMLFNPWCQDDQVFLNDPALLEEYILNDYGKIYSGAWRNIRPKPWNFGQFEDFMLDCCFYLLEKSGLSASEMNDPVKVARKISSIVNAQDNNGVLVGNWSGDYSDGTSPLAWAGSVRILEQYWQTKKPVSFGQCWVFSGVVTTVCRCLGIPARSVTNFASAHDTDANLAIDSHWGWDNEPLEEYNADSIWNFHVWNDVWMKRPGLPDGCDGWQAIDATPQETSDGLYCAGPCSVNAIRDGRVELPYDGAFIFAEVNADRVHWIHAADGSIRKQFQKDTVGKCISTKAPSCKATRWSDREDVTNQYKYREGTLEERSSVWRAASTHADTSEMYNQKDNDVLMDMVDKDKILIGQPFNVDFKMFNASDKERSVDIQVTAKIVAYTGIPGQLVKRGGYQVKLKPNEESFVSLKVEPTDYLDKLVDMAMIRMHALARVVETNQVYCEVDDFRLMKPDIAITAPETVAVGEEFIVQAEFLNPLQKPLTKGEFTVEGPGLQRPLKITLPNPVPVGGIAKITTEKLTAKKSGDRVLIVTFDSLELSDLADDVDIIVKPA